MGDATGDFFAAGALEAMEIYNYDIMQAADASIPQNFRTLAHQTLRIDLVQSQFIALAG